MFVMLKKNAGYILLWAVLFTLAYAQSPLYTSNQNQYFLHGLAQSGLGHLQEDWLANTLDPTPVFSKLIEISWQIFPWRPIFYLYFGVLAGIYLFSISGIANQLWRFHTTRSKQWLFLSVLVILHSAALRHQITQVLRENWDFLLDGGVAGQRLLGGVLQPSTFGVFLVLSIYLFLKRNYVWATICLLVATSFHPTYLLSAGILTGIYMAILFIENRNIRASLALGSGALLGVTPVLWQVYTTYGGTTAALTAQAHEILVSFRIPHHALITEWLDGSVWVKIGFVGLALVVLRTGDWHSEQSAKTEKPIIANKNTEKNFSARVRLFHIILWSAITAVLLTIVQAVSGNLELAIIFPWRLSTWLVPLSISMTAGWVVNWLFERFQLERFSQRVLIVSLTGTLIFAAAGTAKFYITWQDKQHVEERAMMVYVEKHKAAGEVYLTPIKMQDFRLETGAPVYVDFKSIPYKDVEVLEWYHRVLTAGSFYTSGRCDELAQIVTEGITHLVLPVDHAANYCPGIEKRYQDEMYAVLEVISP